MMTTLSNWRRERVTLMAVLLLLFSIAYTHLSFITAETDNIVLRGEDWLFGEGVDIYKNEQGFTGYYQCVEVARRLYNSKGWPLVRTADGGAKSIPEGSPGLISHEPGSGYVPVPGDLIIEGPTAVNGGYGHVAIVDYVEGNTIFAVEQNGARDGRVVYTYNDSFYGSGEGRGAVTAIVHAPQNEYQNPMSEDDSPFSNIGVSNVDINGYSIEIDITDMEPISQINFLTWNDIQGEEQSTINEEMVTLDMSAVSFNVDITDYANIRGNYYTNIEIFNISNESIYNETMEIEIPMLRNINIANEDYQGYTVTADLYGKEYIDKIEIHSWSVVNGDEDVVIEEIPLDNENIEYQIDIANHNNETGRYESEIHVYDQNGNSQLYDVPLATVSEIKNLEIVNQTDTGYTVSAEIVDTNKIELVELETYTKEDGFNSIAKRTIIPASDMLNINILRSTFSNQIGEYINLMHVTDIDGVKTSYKISAFYE